MSTEAGRAAIALGHSTKCWYQLSLSEQKHIWIHAVPSVFTLDKCSRFFSSSWKSSRCIWYFADVRISGSGKYEPASYHCLRTRNYKWLGMKLANWKFIPLFVVLNIKRFSNGYRTIQHKWYQLGLVTNCIPKLKHQPFLFCHTNLWYQMKIYIAIELSKKRKSTNVYLVQGDFISFYHRREYETIDSFMGTIVCFELWIAKNRQRKLQHFQYWDQISLDIFCDFCWFLLKLILDHCISKFGKNRRNASSRHISTCLQLYLETMNVQVHLHTLLCVSYFMI